MSRESTRPLDAGERFPELTLQVLEGESLGLPQDLAEHWTVVLAYRGHF